MLLRFCLSYIHDIPGVPWLSHLQKWRDGTLITPPSKSHYIIKANLMTAWKKTWFQVPAVFQISDFMWGPHVSYRWPSFWPKKGTCAHGFYKNVLFNYRHEIPWHIPKRTDDFPQYSQNTGRHNLSVKYLF